MTNKQDYRSNEINRVLITGGDYKIHIVDNSDNGDGMLRTRWMNITDCELKAIRDALAVREFHGLEPKQGLYDSESWQ